jgi:Fe-S cluster biogenesis protein NfuA
LPPADLDPLALHVERTADAGVLRWVCHGVDPGPVGPRRPEPGSAVARLVADGTVTGMWVEGGHVHVRFGRGTAGTDDVGRVDQAVRAALGDRAAWLVAPGTPSLADLQALVDRGAGALAADHGGRLEVVAVDGRRVVLQAHGACHGCHLSPATVALHVAPAVRERMPGAEVVLVDGRRRRLPWPRRR